jgi:hydrogenase-4 component F
VRLVLPVLVPAALGALAFALQSARARTALLLGGAAAHLACVAWLLAVPPEPTSLLALDPLGRLFLGVTSVIFAVAAAAAKGYLADGAHPAPTSRRFASALLWFLAAMSVVPLARHLAVLWVALEATTLATAPLIYFYRRRPALEATWKYLLLCSVGIALALLGTFFLGIAASGTPGGGSLQLDALVAAAPAMARPWLKAGFVLALVGYGTKMGLAPLHTWLPDAHSQAPSPVSALLSGVVLNGAFLGILRFHQIALASGDAAFARTLLVLLGFASVGVATAFMVRQRDYKRLFAYSSVENMGILAAGVGLGGGATLGALLHAVNHSVAKAGLFLLAGNVLRAYGTTRAAEVRGALRRLPVSGPLLALLFLAIGGIPPFGPFWGELLVFQGALSADPWLGVLFIGLLAVAFLGMAGVVLPMLQPDTGALATETTSMPIWTGTPIAAPGAYAVATLGAPTPAAAAPARERLLAVLPPAILAAGTVLLGLRIPPALLDLLRAAAATLGAAP